MAKGRHQNNVNFEMHDSLVDIFLFKVNKRNTIVCVKVNKNYTKMLGTYFGQSADSSTHYGYKKILKQALSISSGPIILQLRKISQVTFSELQLFFETKKYVKILNSRESTCKSSKGSKRCSVLFCVLFSVLMRPSQKELYRKSFPVNFTKFHRIAYTKQL